MKPRIVVISQNLHLVQDLRKRLSDDLISWVWVGDGREGLDLIKHLPVDMAVVDASLSGMQELELVETIRTSSPDVQVMMTTASYSRQDEIDVRRLGAFYCMTGTGQYDNLCRFLTQAAGLEEVLIGKPELEE